MMATIDLNQILNQIKEEAKIAPPGILQKGEPWTAQWDIQL